MGVHGLWDLLAPVGRRVSVETIAGKRLAIDASIWMIQFMKAMRDEKGEMVRNAHLLGFFRRICKLLYLRTKPVFIFDGGTPALKRRTVIARRRQRENAQANIRKTAEKLLLNQLKQIRCKELAIELEKQRRNTDTKGKKVVADEAEMDQETSGRSALFTNGYDQEALDEMLAASLSAQQDEGFTAGGESSLGVGTRAEDEDGADEDEEMILPEMHGKVDPAVLAALPPSMQLDLLVQMRERLMAENRQKYQRVKKAPARFSELQIQAYLKTVAFRREIDEVQKSAAGRGVGGVQTSRIASEANREFIFSTNFSGDKQVLTSTREESEKSKQSKTAPSNPSTTVTNDVASKTNRTAVVGSIADEPQSNFENDVETYLDEMGRVRVSRVRAMGIRMTRDLQRNLDLMKETEEESACMTKNVIDESTNCRSQVDMPHNPAEVIPKSATINQNSNRMTCVNENEKNEETLLNGGPSIEIMFEDNDKHELGGADDDLFTHLVAGDPVLEFSTNTSLSKKQSLDAGSESFLKKQSLDSVSEPEWEEGGIEVESGTLNKKFKGKPLLPDSMGDESDLEWEEGGFDIREEASSCPAEYVKVVSKGALEEEADLEEAIRRSLEDLADQSLVDTLDCVDKSEAMEADSDFFGKGVDGTLSPPPSTSNNQQHQSSCLVPENTKSPDSIADRNIVDTVTSLEVHLTPNLQGNCGRQDLLPDKARESFPLLDPLMQDLSGNKSLPREIHGTTVEEKDVPPFEGQLTSVIKGGIAADDFQNGFEVAVDNNLDRTTETKGAALKDLVKEVNTPQLFIEGDIDECISTRGDEHLVEVGSLDGRKQEAILEEEMLLLGEEQRELGEKQKMLERNAESVSSEMFAECQELLQIFGLPFIIAPMEAEAQCAYMELVNLVDGVVTDDSDAFLFGARNVYKNIFDDRKYVETYFMKDIENELGLNRDKLIHMALLLGSDYTEGVSGIGIVNAIEVVNAFPEEDGLRIFREWIESPDPSILGKFGSQTRGDADVSGSVDDNQSLKRNFMNKHRNVSKNWQIPSSFPSNAVISAYSSPQVDKSTEPFSWGKPDHFVLRKLCWEKFGWSTQKADELLLPVLKEYNKRETQLRLEAFYNFNERFAKIQSKRIKKAVRGITGNKSLDLMDDDSVQDGPRSKKKRANQNFADVRNEAKITENVNESESRNIGSLGRPSHPGGKRNRLPTGNLQGRSRGVAVRRRGSARVRGGARSKSLSSGYSSSSPDDQIGGDSAQGVQGSSGEQHGIRSSRRPRKEVNYSVFNMKSDDERPREGDGAMEESSADMEEDITAAVRSKSRSENLDQEPSGGNLEKDDGYNDGKSEGYMGKGYLYSSLADDIVLNAQLSNEYLKVGGGFCLDEEDTADKDLKGSTKCPREVTTYESDPSNLGEVDIRKSLTKTMDLVEAERSGNRDSCCATNEDPDDNASSDRSEAASFQEFSNEGDYAKDSSRYFRAIPNLRRKRRKT